jgi:hypothetical protein
MAINPYRFDLSRIRVSEEEILADLVYPARPRPGRSQRQRRARRAARRWPR